MLVAVPASRWFPDATSQTMMLQHKTSAGISQRAGSRPQAFRANVSSSRVATCAPARPAVQKLAVHCQAGVWSERPVARRLNFPARAGWTLVCCMSTHLRQPGPAQVQGVVWSEVLLPLLLLLPLLPRVDLPFGPCSCSTPQQQQRQRQLSRKHQPASPHCTARKRPPHMLS